MTTCTDFCERLKALSVDGEGVPSHDKLLTELHFSTQLDEYEKSLGYWHDLCQRSCEFCQLVADAVASSTDHEVDPNREITIVVFPEEQSFRISYPSRLGLRLAFVVESLVHGVGPDNARPLSDKQDAILDIKRWLDRCDVHHDCLLNSIKKEDSGRSGFDFGEPLTSNFRVLDLEQGCIVRAALDVKYVTLSYVWGQTPMFRLTKDNFVQLTTPGVLTSIHNSLPATIRDAINLASALKLQYIWIDSLCLVQDDDPDVTLGVSMMNSIYNGSYFTLVAGAGADASTGLSSSSRQIIRKVGNTRMTYFHSIDANLKRSIYNKRGWTLQELVLPQRTVIFINGQVYFRCQRANWCQETWSDNWVDWLDPDDSNIIRLPDLNKGLIPSFWAYQKICEDYSRRQIRRDGDALRAVAGITRPLASGMETPLIEGLPGYYLDHFLLFISSDGNLRRRSRFASFSWAGWQGVITWPRENYVWHHPTRTWEISNIILYLKNCSLINFVALSRTNSRQELTEHSSRFESDLLKLTREHPTVFANDVDLRNVGIRWGSGLGSHRDMPRWKTVYVHGSQVPMTDEQAIERGLQERRPFSLKALNLANGQAEFDRIVSKITDIREKAALMNWKAAKQYRLRETAQTAFGPSPGRRAKLESCNFRDSGNHSEDQRVTWAKHRAEKQKERDGSVLEIPDFPIYTVLQFVTITLRLKLGRTQPRGERSKLPFSRIPAIPLLYDDVVVGSLHADNLDMLPAEGSLVELIIITRSSTPTIASVLPEEERDLFWCLHVVWKQQIAERRGVGQILERALDIVKPKPELKSILLG